MRVDIEPCSFARPPLRRPRAVVADDNAAMRAVVSELLHLDGYDVEEAADGVALLLHVSRASLPRASAALDLVVSDVEMPFCTGLDVLRKLRNGRVATPVVLMTGAGDGALEAQAAALGARLLQKPFTFDELRGAVAQVRGLPPPRRRQAR